MKLTEKEIKEITAFVQNIKTEDIDQESVVKGIGNNGNEQWLYRIKNQSNLMLAIEVENDKIINAELFMGIEAASPNFMGPNDYPRTLTIEFTSLPEPKYQWTGTQHPHPGTFMFQKKKFKP